MRRIFKMYAARCVGRTSFGCQNRIAMRLFSTLIIQSEMDILSAAWSMIQRMAHKHGVLTREIVKIRTDANWVKPLLLIK